MRTLKYAAVLGLVIALAGAMASTANAQVRVGVAIGVGAPAYVGPAPVCAYGYYPYAPYACAPYGYYGPEWFASGVFIGAGPWFHGFYGRAFYGHPVFYDRAWVDFHGNGWRYYRGGAEWRGFRGGEAFHGNAVVRDGAGFRSFGPRGDVHARGNFHGNARVGTSHAFRGGNHDFRGNAGFHGGGNRGFHGGGNRGGGHGGRR